MATLPSPSAPILSTGQLVKELPGPIGLLGLGEENLETLKFLWRHGRADLVVCEKSRSGWTGDEPWSQAIPFFGGEGHAQGLAGCRTVIRSPGIRPDAPPLLAARQAGAQVTSATRLFLAACPGPVVGVTGTAGKGTCSTLLQLALAACGLKTRLGGNIGTNPLAFLDDLTPDTVTVLELSSFQLMDLAGRRPEVAVVLRTSSEHLNWHTDTAEYRRAKGGLLAPKGTPQKLIYCADSAGSREIAAGRETDGWAVSLAGPVAQGVGLGADGRLALFGPGFPPLEGLEPMALAGRFNLENGGAALLAALALGCPLGPAAQAIAAFKGLPHRLEPAGSLPAPHGRITCYNDSYATRPEASQAALGAFEGPLAAILGGSDKGADFTELGQATAAKAGLERVVLMGATADKLERAIRQAAERLGQPPPPIQRAQGLEQALALAAQALPQGGVLLFSPACASFDQFPNYKVRGETFLRLVASQPGFTPPPR